MRLGNRFFISCYLLLQLFSRQLLAAYPLSPLSTIGFLDDGSHDTIARSSDLMPLETLLALKMTRKPWFIWGVAYLSSRFPTPLSESGVESRGSYAECAQFVSSTCFHR